MKYFSEYNIIKVEFLITQYFINLLIIEFIKHIIKFIRFLAAFRSGNV